jgi:DDE superfamily endonuclease
MFGFIAEIPTRLKHLFSKFKKHLTKPQYENFCRTELGIMTAAKGEYDIKSINEQFIQRKNQSSLNRFITEAKWNLQPIVNQGRELLLSESELNLNLDYKIIDDTVCKKYGSQTEMVCYNHSSTMGTVLSHNYVTSLYVNNEVAVSDGLRLYGNEQKCKEKGIAFKTRLELAMELIEEHKPVAKNTIWLWDSWYTCSEMAQECRLHGYNWIGEIKSNRVVFYDGERFRLDELCSRLCSEGAFCDVVVNGELFLAAGVEVFMPKVGRVSIIVNVKADTRDVHFLCTDLTGFSVYEVVLHALQRHRIEDFYKEAKALGFGEYRFRTSEAALIHAHLVVLAHTLLDVLRRRLLRYSIVGSRLSIGGTVEWLRRSAMHLFIHKVRSLRASTKTILRLIDTR